MDIENKTIIEDSTERKILEASKRVFLKKGMYGARMQEIADEAGINKALLHYYFRSKDKLFDAVFQDTATVFFARIRELIGVEKPIFEKIEYFVNEYLELLIPNSFIPGFIISEVQQNPDRVKNIFMQSGVNPEMVFAREIEEAVEKGIIIPIDPEQLIINIISLCVFPFVASPIIKPILNYSEEDFRQFTEVRKKELAVFIINAIKVK